MKRASSLLWIIICTIICNVGIILIGQGTGTPSTLRVRTDSNGYLMSAGAVQTPPYFTSTFNNTRLKTDSNGNLLVASTGGIAPADAQYWVGAADSTLSAEKNLGALSTALVINTAGVPSAYAGVTCTNQFLRVLSAVGAGTCATVNLASGTDVTGALPIANGGTGAATQAAYTVFSNSTGSTAAPTWTTVPVYKAGTGTETRRSGGIIHTDMSVVGSTGGGGQTNALTYTLPANTLDTNGQFLIVRASLIHANNTNATSYFLRVNTTSDLGSTCATANGISGFTIKLTRISSTILDGLGSYEACGTLGRASTRFTVNDLGTMNNDIIVRIDAATTTNDIQTQSFIIEWNPTAP